MRFGETARPTRAGARARVGRRPSMTVVCHAPFRLVRGCAVAGVGTALAVGAHVAGGGEGVPVVPVLLPVLALSVGCVVAARRAWTLGRLLLALLALQAVVHGSLWLTSGDHPVDPRLAELATSHAAHVHGASSNAPGMLAAHAVAVLVAAGLLAGVDRAVLMLWRLGRAVLGVRPAVAPLPSALVVVPVTPSPSRPRSLAVLVSPRRGPPVLLAPC